MNLLCSGMVGFDLQRNLGTAEKEHPSPPSSPSEGRRGTVVLHQSDRKQMEPFTFTDEERQYLSDHRRGKSGGGVLFFSCPQISS